MSDKKGKDKSQKWRCSLCEFDNSQLLDICQMCQSKRNDKLKLEEQQLDIAQHVDVGIICSNSKCKAINEISAEKCKQCKKILFQDLDQVVIPQDHHKKLKYCYNCAFQNDSLNKNCVSCQISFTKVPFKSHMSKYGMAGASRNHPKAFYCQDCGKKMEKNTAISIYSTISLDSYSDYICKNCLKQKYIGMDYFCLFCDNKLKRQQQNSHKQNCLKRIEFFDTQKNESFKRCTKLQINTVLYMHNKCETLHQEMKPLLIEKIKKIGYSQKDLDNLHHYVINYAPIIIHVRVNMNMQFFVKDTHYRNCFQIHEANYDPRVQWEDRMFDRFHHRATHYERVKYGTMNFTNDPNGVMACSGYGKSYFLLKNHVRDRCTITDMDSASPTATIATFRFLFHLFIKLSNEQLKSAIQASKGKQMLSNVIIAYKQIQIHGPVEFSKDIERVYICKQQLQPDQNLNLGLVKQFCAKNKLQYQIFSQKVNQRVPYPNMKIVVKQAPKRILNKEVEEKLNATIEKKKKSTQNF